MLRLFRIDQHTHVNELTGKTEQDNSMNIASPAIHNTSSRFEENPERKKRFLIVEDESDIANLIAMHLQDLDAEITMASDGMEGLRYALEEQWDAILLDLQLPKMDGLDICREIRAKAGFVPIMMLTSRSSELDRVLGLEIGADDYMVKPFSIPELKARVKALMRRAKQASSAAKPSAQEIQFDGLTLDESARKVTLDNQILELTAKEFDLLWFFASQPGVVFKRADLLDKVWGYGHEGYEHTVNSHINRLRAKLEKDPAKPKYIQTVWGVGYRLGN